MADTNPKRIGCGVEGCLTAAVILFVVLLILMLIAVSIRFAPSM